MNNNLDEFCENWLTKADEYSEDQLSGYFDRFISLYIVFNSLYMEIWNTLGREGISVIKDFKDKKASSEYVVQYLKSGYFLDRIMDDATSRADYQTISNIIANEQFNVVLEWGNPKRDQDIKLNADLMSNNRNKKAIALLSIFYYIRCNIFHGHKGFEQRQVNLLLPLNRLLRKTIDIILQKMRDQ